MKRLAGILAGIACAVAISFGLVGCGSSDSVDTTKFVGVWNLSSIEASSGSNLSSVPESDIELMQSLGMRATLTLDADGTAELDLFGEVTSGEWSDKGEGGLTLTMGGQDISLTIEQDGRLKMTQGSDAIFFKNANDAGNAQASTDGTTQGAADGGSQGADSASGSTQSGSDSASGTQSGNDSAGDAQGGSDASGGTQGGSDTSGSTQGTGDASSGGQGDNGTQGESSSSGGSQAIVGAI